MLKLEDLLVDEIESERILQEHFRSLSVTLSQQLQETKRRLADELERRIHHNALISTKKELTHESKDAEQRRKHLHMAHSRQLERTSSSNLSTGEPLSRSHQCNRAALWKTTQLRKEHEDEIECQKKFCALPVPSHVSLPLYQKMMARREKEREQGLEERKKFLLSMQKPFSFQERDRDKRQKLVAKLNEVSEERKTATDGDSPYKDRKNTDKEIKKKAHLQTGQHESTIYPSKPRLRTAERTRKKMGFWDEKPSFQPKIIHQVPNFNWLHKALQTAALSKTQSNIVTKCQPFHLRTSVIAERRKQSPENSWAPNGSTLSRSKSCGALTSLSADTLPVYMMDAVRKRWMAIRHSMEMRDSNNRESTEWLRKYQKRTQAMKKTVSHRAKWLDPHSSLREVYDEKVKHHRQADQQRMREYARELRDMKARVNERPFLFELVKQKNARVHAEQTYRDQLRRAGIKEEFVEENGGAVERTSTLCGLKDVEDMKACSAENGIHINYKEEENVDAGEKIEDVEEKSVKS